MNDGKLTAYSFGRLPSGLSLMGIEFRDYSSSDRDQCETIFRSNIPRYFRDNELPDFLEFIDQGQCPYTVVVAGDEVVACGGYGIRSESSGADLCWGMVHASKHRQRLGELLLVGRLHKIIQLTTVQFVRLGTCQLTEGFFARYGFETLSTSADGLAEGLDDVQMKLELTDRVREQINHDWAAVFPIR